MGALRALQRSMNYRRKLIYKPSFQLYRPSCDHINHFHPCFIGLWKRTPSRTLTPHWNRSYRCGSLADGSKWTGLRSANAEQLHWLWFMPASALQWRSWSRTRSQLSALDYLPAGLTSQVCWNSQTAGGSCTATAEITARNVLVVSKFSL